MNRTFLHAQTATVSGRIVDEDGNPVEEVQIAVNGAGTQGARTNAQGNYTLTIPAGQEVEIIFFNISFNEIRKKVTAGAGETIVLNQRMTFKNELPVVTATGENRKVDLIYIQPKEYFKLAGPNPDISKLLLAQGMGVQSSNELSSSYSVRGGNYDENLVYVNDIEVFRPFLVRSGQQEGLSFPNPDMVSSMYFSSGGFEAKYGDKMSSVLDVQYRKPRDFSTTVSGGLLGGSLHTQGITRNRLFSWQLGGRYRSTQYLLRTLDTKGEYRPSFYDIQSLLNFDFSPKFNLEVLTNVTGNKYLVVPENRETTFGTFNQALRLKVYFDGQEISQYTTYFGAISATLKPTDSLRLKFIASAYRDLEDETFTVQGQYYIDELNTDFGSASFGNVAFNRGVGTYINHGRNFLDATILNLEHKGRFQRRQQEFLWGARVQHEIVNDKLSEWSYIDSAGYSIPQGDMSLVDLPYVIKQKNEVPSSRAMAYAEYAVSKDLRDTSTITFTGGLRSNYWTFNKQNVISPRATVSYDPNWSSDWVFRASCGYYYQVPFYREMRDFYGKVNPDIKAQQSIHYVLSGDLNFRMWRRAFKFMSAVYYKQMNSLVPYDIDNVRIRYFATNNSRGYARGIDLRLNGEFIRNTESWISLSVMQTRENIDLTYYTYTDTAGEAWYPGVSVTRLADSTLHTSTGYIPRPTDQLVTFNMFFQDYLPKLPRCKMYLSLIYGHGLPVTPPNHNKYMMSDKFRYPSYKRVDIGFSYEFIKEDKPLPATHRLHRIKAAWLSLEVWNLLGINNTVSYTWIKDVTNRQYAIPNYLTNRQLNLKLQIKF